MAKKRSKRAAKASAAKSKHRGKARAAPARAKPTGVINAWEQDPGDGAQPSGGQVIQRPVPVLREQPFSIRIVNPASAPEAKPHSPGTADFRYWTAAEALRRGADFWGALLPGTSWEVGSILPVDLDFGSDLNAFYDREGLKFFHGTGAGRTVFSGESPDVVCHELGHAVLDSFKPQLFDAASIEVAAFHESFGDMSALLSALQLPSVREGVLVETGGALGRSSRLSRLAEQLAWAIRQSVPSAVEPDCLRNAVNTFFYRDPDTLPTTAPAASLSSEPHSLSRVFTGAFFEGLAGMLATTKKKDEAALLQVSSRLKPMSCRCAAASSATVFCRRRWRWPRRVRECRGARRRLPPPPPSQRACRRFICRSPSMGSEFPPLWFMPLPSPSASRSAVRRLPSARRHRRGRIRPQNPSSRICCGVGGSRSSPSPANQVRRSCAPPRPRPTKRTPTNYAAKEDRWCCAGCASTADMRAVEGMRAAPV